MASNKRLAPPLLRPALIPPFLAAVFSGEDRAVRTALDGVKTGPALTPQQWQRFLALLVPQPPAGAAAGAAALTALRIMARLPSSKSDGRPWLSHGGATGAPFGCSVLIKGTQEAAKVVWQVLQNYDDATVRLWDTRCGRSLTYFICQRGAHWLPKLNLTDRSISAPSASAPSPSLHALARCAHKSDAVCTWRSVANAAGISKALTMKDATGLTPPAAAAMVGNLPLATAMLAAVSDANQQLQVLDLHDKPSVAGSDAGSSFVVTAATQGCVEALVWVMRMRPPFQTAAVKQLVAAVAAGQPMLPLLAATITSHQYVGHATLVADVVVPLCAALEDDKLLDAATSQQHDRLTAAEHAAAQGQLPFLQLLYARTPPERRHALLTSQSSCKVALQELAVHGGHRATALWLACRPEAPSIVDHLRQRLEVACRRAVPEAGESVDACAHALRCHRLQLTFEVACAAAETEPLWTAAANTAAPRFPTARPGHDMCSAAEVWNIMRRARWPQELLAAIKRRDAVLVAALLLPLPTSVIPLVSFADDDDTATATHIAALDDVTSLWLRHVMLDGPAVRVGLRPSGTPLTEQGHAAQLLDIASWSAEDLDATDAWGRTPLHVAVHHNDLVSVQALTARHTDDIAKRGAWNWRRLSVLPSPLEYAVDCMLANGLHDDNTDPVLAWVLRQPFCTNALVEVAMRRALAHTHSDCYVLNSVCDAVPQQPVLLGSSTSRLRGLLLCAAWTSQLAVQHVLSLLAAAADDTFGVDDGLRRSVQEAALCDVWAALMDSAGMSAAPVEEPPLQTLTLYGTVGAKAPTAERDRWKHGDRSTDARTTVTVPPSSLLELRPGTVVQAAHGSVVVSVCGTGLRALLAELCDDMHRMSDFLRVCHDAVVSGAGAGAGAGAGSGSGAGAGSGAGSSTVDRPGENPWQRPVCLLHHISGSDAAVPLHAKARDEKARHAHPSLLDHTYITVFNAEVKPDVLKRPTPDFQTAVCIPVARALQYMRNGVWRYSLRPFTVGRAAFRSSAFNLAQAFERGASNSALHGDEALHWSTAVQDLLVKNFGSSLGLHSTTKGDHGSPAVSRETFGDTYFLFTWDREFHTRAENFVCKALRRSDVYDRVVVAGQLTMPPLSVAAGCTSGPGAGAAAVAATATQTDSAAPPDSLVSLDVVPRSLLGVRPRCGVPVCPSRSCVPIVTVFRLVTRLCSLLAFAANIDEQLR